MDTLNLTASYTHTYADGEVARLAVKVKDRTSPVTGRRLVTISNVAALLQDEVAAIGEYDRLHVQEVLLGASVTLCPQPRDIASGLVTSRREGRIVTGYQGCQALPVAVVLDLGERLYDQLIGA